MRRPGPLRRRRRDQRGFTLIELLVVIIILGLIAGLVGPRLFGRVGQSKQAAARAQIELLGAALDQFRLDNGAYPPAGAGLHALVQNPNLSGWSGPYLKKPAVPADPWGRAYQYKCCPGDHGDYDIWTYGADGAPGGDGEDEIPTSHRRYQRGRIGRRAVVCRDTDEPPPLLHEHRLLAQARGGNCERFGNEPAQRHQPAHLIACGAPGARRGRPSVAAP